MNNTRKFDLICDRISKMDRAFCLAMDFSRICEDFHADPRCMDNMFYDLFGMSGEEVMEQLADGRMDFPE